MRLYRVKCQNFFFFIHSLPSLITLIFVFSLNSMSSLSVLSGNGFSMMVHGRSCRLSAIICQSSTVVRSSGFRLVSKMSCNAGGCGLWVVVVGYKRGVAVLLSIYELPLGYAHGFCGLFDFRWANVLVGGIGLILVG